MPKKPMKITLKYQGESADGKWGFIEAKENNGDKDLCMKVQFDDKDPAFVMRALKEVIRRCNAANPK